MRRHEALIPLTHDHHHALVQVRKLRKAAAGSDDDRLAAAGEFVEFFHAETIKHFREEEEVVFPLVSDSFELRAMIEDVLAQHAHIHALVRGIEREVREGVVSPERSLQLATYLERHIRFEEKAVFPSIESRVGKAALEAITLSPRQRAHAS